MQTKITELLPLTTALVQECTEERTQDFTMALWEFVRWDDNKNKILEGASTPGFLGPILSGGKNSKVVDISNDAEVVDLEDEERIEVADSSNSTVFKYYIWPDFILDLLNHPTAWAAWRKKTERDLMGGNNCGSGRLSEGVTVDLSGVTVQEEMKKVFHRPVSRRIAYFTALCAGREAELDEKR